MVFERCFVSALILFLSFVRCHSQQTSDRQCRYFKECDDDEGSADSDSIAALRQLMDATSRQVKAGFDRLEQSMTRISERVANCERQQTDRHAYCVVSVRAYSANDTVGSVGYVKLNGREIWKAGWLSNAPNLRGLNTIIIDPFLCTHSDVRRFDLWENVESPNDLIAYLQYLHDGAVVVGVTGDEPSRYIGPALRTLAAAGVFVEDVRSRGNFAFVLQKGYSGKTVMRKSQTYSYPGSTVDVRIQGSSVEDLTFTPV